MTEMDTTKILQGGILRNKLLASVHKLECEQLFTGCSVPGTKFYYNMWHHKPLFN